jgi:hypothetical protein
METHQPSCFDIQIILLFWIMLPTKDVNIVCCYERGVITKSELTYEITSQPTYE